MTSDLFKSWLDNLNSKKATESRSLFLIDNFTAHQDVVISINVKYFIASQTTSKLQPCDAHGILKNVKTLYRKQRLSHVFNHMDAATSASDLARKYIYPRAQASRVM